MISCLKGKHKRVEKQVSLMRLLIIPVLQSVYNCCLSARGGWCVCSQRSTRKKWTGKRISILIRDNRTTDLSTFHKTRRVIDCVSRRNSGEGF